MLEELRDKLMAIMQTAEDSQAWVVAIMLAKLLDDLEAIDRFTDRLVYNIEWHVPLVERTDDWRRQKKKELIERYASG